MLPVSRGLRPRSGKGQLRSANVIRLATLALVILSMLLAPSRAFGSTGGAPSGCTSGWTVVAKYDNSFVWQGVGLPLRSVSWTGAVWLKEKLDSNCYVVGIRLDYTGPTSGGTLVVNGNPFVSYTVQDPDPFTDYANVGTNA